MRNFFIPNKNNNYRAHLLSKVSLIFYSLLIFVSNLLFAQIGFLTINADITIQELLELHNEERNKNGLSNFTIDPKLTQSATLKSEAMLAADCWSHFCPEGKSPWDFFDEAGYFYVYAGENLAEGFNDTIDVINAWMNSPTHRDNILNGNFTEIGFGFAYGNYQGRDNNVVLTVHFGQEIGVGRSANLEIENSNQEIDINNIENTGEGDENEIKVEGSISTFNSEVRVDLDDNELGRVDADGQNYTFRSPENVPDGTYNLQSKLLDDNGNVLAESEAKPVFLDNNLPKIIGDSIIIEKVKDSIQMEFNTSTDVENVSIDLPVENLIQSDNFTWQIQIKIERIQKSLSEEFTLKLYDTSNNSDEFKINKEDLLSISETKDGGSVLSIESLSDQGKQVREILTYIFIIYLGTLMIIDFMVLAKSNKLIDISRKSNLQFSLLIVMILAMNISGFGGSILTGLNI